MKRLLRPLILVPLYAFMYGVLILSKLFAKRLEVRIREFWKWFERREEALFRFELDQEELFREVTRELERVDEHLTFEFGPESDGKRDFLISAGGIRRSFPLVEALAAAAPPLERWRIVRYRQPREVSAIRFGAHELSPHDVRLTLSLSRVGSGEGDAESLLDVALFLGPPDMPEEARGQIAFLFLDSTLGEEAVATKLGEIRIAPRDDAPAEGTVGLDELRRACE